MTPERYIVREAISEYHEMYWELVDTTTGRILGSDGGEPEDQLLVRDWKWVAVELNAQAAELAAAGDREALCRQALKTCIAQREVYEGEAAELARVTEENRELNMTISRLELIFNRAKVEYQGDSELSLRQFFVMHQRLEADHAALLAKMADQRTAKKDRA